MAATVEVSETRIIVDHVTVSSSKPYAAVKQDLESRLGRLDDHIRTLSRQGAQEAISEYHQGQINGGFGETQRRYTSQKG